jgi:hypothetical protein
MFSSAYTPVPITSWQANWSTCCNDLVDPYLIGAHPVKKYSLHHFVGIEYPSLDTSTMTTFHIDLWSPNPSAKFQIQLVQNVGGSQIVGIYNATGLTTAGWNSLEIPLSSFAPSLGAHDKLGQMLFLALNADDSTSVSTVYVDNIYFHK